VLSFLFPFIFKTFSDKTEDYQNYSVLCCVSRLYTVISTVDLTGEPVDLGFCVFFLLY